MRYQSTLTLLPALMLAGCVGTYAEQESNDMASSAAGLAETDWELRQLVTTRQEPVSIQEIVPQTYLISLKPDGSMTFRVDCNRGFGKWTAGDQVTGEGKIALSDMGVTKAMCAPDSISDTVVSDMSLFGNYAIKNGELRIATKDGNKTYVWRPNTGQASED